MVLRELGLPKEKLDQIVAVTERANSEVRPMEEQVARSRAAITAELAATKPDEAKLAQYLEEETRAELAVRKNRLFLLLRVREIMGPDAWQKATALEARGGPARLPWPRCSADGTCPGRLVCCREPARCAGQCVPDCRNDRDGICPPGRSCDRDSGVCFP